MLKWDGKSSTLLAYKVEEPCMPEDDDSAESYKLYRTCTIAEDIEYFRQVLEKTLDDPTQEVLVSYRVGDLHNGYYRREIKKPTNRYYPVFVKLRIGVRSYDEIELLRIPYLEKTGLLCIKGERRAVQLRVRPTAQLSYNQSKGVLTLPLPKQGKIDIELTKTKGAVLTAGDKRVPLLKLARAMAFETGEKINLDALFTNMAILRNLTHESDEVNHGIMTDDKWLAALSSEYWQLGEMRKSLNKILTLDRAVGCTLSRPAGDLNTGTVLTEKNLPSLRGAEVLYVRDRPDISGCKTVYPVFVQSARKGEHNLFSMRAAKLLMKSLII